MPLIKVNWRPEPNLLRNFGGICLLFFSALAMSLQYRGSLLGIHVSESAVTQLLSTILITLAVGCGVMAVTVPRILLPLYWFLTAVSLPLGFVMSYVILGVLFFLAFAPFGLVARLFGWDPMHRKFDSNATTYWKRRQTDIPAQRYLRQY